MAGSARSQDSQYGFEETRDDIPLKEAKSDESFDGDEPLYPSLIKLLPILIGLGLQSFCIALVRQSRRLGVVSR